MKWFRFGIGALLIFSLVFLPEPNEDYLFLQTLRQMAEDCLESVREQGQPVGLQMKRLEIDGAGVEANQEAAEREIRRIIVLDMGLEYIALDQSLWREADGQLQKIIRQEADPEHAPLALTLTAWKGEGQGTLRFHCPALGIEEERHLDFFRWTSLLPPFLAILLALVFQRTILALFCGVWLGATLLEGLNPLAGLGRFAERYLFEQALKDQFRVDIIGFVVGLCATVGVLTRGGGVQGLVDKITRFSRTVRSTQLVTYLMGLMIFFDDYANCIIVGNTARPITDRMKISREKLAYLVDSTAAPVAGLSMLSTWIAYEVSTFAAQLPEAGIQESAYEIFFQTIPYRFYCLLTLLFIGIQILLQRDFGPMLKAERRARRDGGVIRSRGRPMVSSSLTKIRAKEGIPPRWFNGLLPILCMIIVTIEELWRMGGGWDLPLSHMFSADAVREVLGAAADDNSARPILIGSFAGFFLACLLMISQRILSIGECLKAALASTKALFFAIAILFLAWCIGGVCADIGTAHYLIAIFKGVIDPLFFPTILFFTSCLVAFATGSSWSTMSILLPNTVIFAVKMGELSAIGPMPMLVLSIGAVLEGSIFGDHCSPISDTTILSSVSSASDHMDHIKTQAPYALCTMTAAVLLGYIPAALGMHPLISLVCASAVLTVFLLLVGKNPSARMKS